MKNKQEFLDWSKYSGWSLQEILDCYKSISLNALVKATMADEELNYFAFALAYYKRAESNKQVYFQPLEKEFIHETILNCYAEFINRFEQDIKNDSDHIVLWVCDDSTLKHNKGIFDLEQAVYLLRDQILFDIIFKVYRYMGFIHQRKEFDSKMSHLTKYDSKIHKGNKFNCYKNHLVVDAYGLKLIGTSMLYQRVIKLEQLNSFDSFFDVFDNYFLEIMNKCGINETGVVNEKDFAKDIKKVINMICVNNVKFTTENYGSSVEYEKIEKNN